MTKTTRTQIRDALTIGGSYADDASFMSRDSKTGEWTIRDGFFYRSGRDAGSHAASVSRDLTAAGITHAVIDSGEVDGRPFRGGANVRSQNHFWVRVRING